MIDARVLRALRYSRNRGTRRTTVGAVARRLRADPVQVLGAVERLRRTVAGRAVIGRQ